MPKHCVTAQVYKTHIMSSIKIPKTRQNLINMMYLVLTAILALNVSKDILDAFVIVNEGLETTVENFAMKNAMLYSEFDLAKSVDPDKVTPFWIRAQQAKQFSEDMTTFIEEMKIRLMRETSDLEEAVADTIGLAYIDEKENYDTPTHILIGNSEDGSAGISRVLKEKIIDFKNKMLGLLGAEESKHTNLGLDTEDQTNTEGIYTWEMKNFYHTPLAAAITILTKIQNDIKNAEFHVVNNLYKSVGKHDIPFDTIAAKVIAPSNYVLLGDEYRSEVFIAGFSTTQNPEIFLGEYDSTLQIMTSVSDSLPVFRGLGRYSVKAEKEGLHQYEGIIKVKTSDNKIKSYPFKSEYIVARPSLVVSPTKMNVLYKGIENPVSISVPGMASENLSVSISGGNSIRKTGNGTYEVKISNSSPRKANISVTATLSSGEKRNMGSMEFRVKNLPKPYAKIGDIINTGRMNRNALKVQRVKAEYDPNFDFQLPIRIKSFIMESYYKGVLVSEKSNNGKLTDNMKLILEKIPSKTKVYFFKIRAVGKDDFVHELSPILIRIN